MTKIKKNFVINIRIFKFALYICGNSSVGRASASQAEGRGFESRLPLKTLSHLNLIIWVFSVYFLCLNYKIYDDSKEKLLTLSSTLVP